MEDESYQFGGSRALRYDELVHSQCMSARNNRNFVQFKSSRRIERCDSMSRLVECSEFTILY